MRNGAAQMIIIITLIFTQLKAQKEWHNFKMIKKMLMDCKIIKNQIKFHYNKIAPIKISQSTTQFIKEIMESKNWTKKKSMSLEATQTWEARIFKNQKTIITLS